MRAVVRYLAVEVGAVVQSVGDEGRRLRVLTDEGDTIEFVLRSSTGAYHALDGGSRLTLLPD
jgi:hypothetical protein